MNGLCETPHVAAVHAGHGNAAVAREVDRVLAGEAVDLATAGSAAAQQHVVGGSAGLRAHSRAGRKAWGPPGAVDSNLRSPALTRAPVAPVGS